LSIPRSLFLPISIFLGINEIRGNDVDLAVPQSPDLAQ
jgi:hypothetical protein